MNKRKVLDSLYYTFNPSGRVISFSIIPLLKQKDILMIVNLTSNTVIYNFACTNEGGSLIGSNLTLTFNTTSMKSSDNLMIIIGEEDKNEELLSKILSEIKDLNEVVYKLYEKLNVYENTV